MTKKNLKLNVTVDIEPRAVNTKVRGVTFANSDGKQRQALIRAHVRAGDPLRLHYRPIGQDSNACEVWAAERPGCANLWRRNRGVMIGYLSSDLAAQFHKDVQDNRITATVTEVTGGGSKSAGVNVKLVWDS